MKLNESLKLTFLNFASHSEVAPLSCEIKRPRLRISLGKISTKYFTCHL